MFGQSFLECSSPILIAIFANEIKGGTRLARATFPAKRRLNRHRTVLDMIAYEE